VRRPGVPKIRIRAEYGTPEFDALYLKAIHGESEKHDKAKAGTLRWLWLRYQDSTAWRGLSKATRKQRENIMSHILPVSGDWAFASIKRGDIAATRDAKRETPAQARNYLDLMRGLFRWAVEAGHAKADPTLGVKNPPKPQGPGFEVWTDAEIARYRKKWPLGTRERVWLELLRYTGMRRGDVVRIGPQDVRGGAIHAETEKSGKKIGLTIGILPELQAALDAGPIGKTAFIVGKLGEPLTKESFGNFFREACLAAGVDKSAHGLRKYGATKAAEAGASERELEALFGWRGGAMASLYTRSADRSKMALGAIAKLGENFHLQKGGTKRKKSSRNNK
jgi:integrase